MTITPVPTKGTRAQLSHDDWNSVSTAVGQLIDSANSSDAQQQVVATQIASLQTGLASASNTMGNRLAVLENANTSNQSAIAGAVATGTSNSNRITALENVSLPAVPNAVTNVHTTSMTTTTAVVAWTAPAAGAAPTDYLVEWSLQGSNAWSTAGAGLVGGTGVTKTVTGLTASTAAVTQSYLFRVTARNAAGPSASTVVTPTASSTLVVAGASPNNTVIIAPTTSVITDASGNAWGITSDGRVSVNGVADQTTLGVVEMAFVSSVIWQLNQSADWYSKTSPSATWAGPTKVSPLPQSNTATPPPQAVAAGYTTLVGGAEFASAGDVTNDISGGTVAPFYNWFDGNQLAANGWTLDPANSAMAITQTQSYGAGLSTTNNYSLAAKSTPTAKAQPNGHGCLYKYGYFEVRMAFTPGSNVNGPAIYMWGGNNSGSSTTLEIDIMEWDGQRGVYEAYQSVHNWSGSGDIGGAQGWPASTTSPQVIDMTPGAFNTYGVLISPTTLRFYINNIPGVLWRLDVANFVASDGNVWTGSQQPIGQTINVDSQWMDLRLGTWAQTPTFDWARIWQ